MNDNRMPLTHSYCSDTKERLIFHPETAEEAKFIGDQLNAMGFRFYQEEYRQQMAVAAAGCIYLDTDKTIMVTEGRSTDGILCSPDHFEAFYIGEGQRIKGRIPDEEFRQHHMVFYPKTLTEARSIMGVFNQAGLEIEMPEQGFALPVSRAAMQGIAVKDGVVRFAPTPEDLRDAEICTAADIGILARGAMSAEQVTIMAAFNEMAARMEQMSQRLAKLEAEILPRDIPKGNNAATKPAVRRPI